jgi:hypothetical protein
MKRATIEEAAIDCVTQDYYGAEPIPHPVRDPIQERFYRMGAEWALEQVREWAEKQGQLSADNRTFTSYHPGRESAFCEVVDFCDIEEDK